MSNIFNQPFDTPNGVIPFDRITFDDYEPAFRTAITLHDDEIYSIADNPEPPTMDNTVIALERSGAMLSRVMGVFSAMLSADAEDRLMELAQKLSPLLTEHGNSITLNEKLWQRIKVLHDTIDPASLDVEERMLLDNTYQGFVRSGAALVGDDRKRYRELTKHLSESSLRFGQNFLKATAEGLLWLDDDQLDGLPESALAAARQAATDHGGKTAHLITLQAPSYMAFMKYSSHRDLRERLYRLEMTQCTGGEWDNTALTVDIANTRLELARLLGYRSFADYCLERMMAQDAAHVYDMLYLLRDAYREPMAREQEQLSTFAAEYEGHPVELMPWDYAYYANKLKERDYAINDEELRPYFELSAVIQGVFGLATRLYGITFVPNDTASVFHPDVKVYDVNDGDGTYLGTLYTDFFPRTTKRSGAWMTDFVQQHHDAAGHDVRPLVSLTMNFTPPVGDKPSLLTVGEVRTFLHEFGHALHSLLSQVRYESLSGTNVRRDFVEMPSQFNENFLYRGEFLDGFARHYVTGEPLPQAMIDRLIAASRFRAAFACMRQLGLGFLDMAWHSVTEPVTASPEQVERKAFAQAPSAPHIDGCMMSVQFSHIFAGGYAAGYYGYKWAEVLDADVFERFVDDGVFNRETAKQFRQLILSRGGTEAPMTLYLRFMGREPRIDALLRRDGVGA